MDPVEDVNYRLRIAHNAMEEIDAAGAEADRCMDEYHKKFKVPLIGFLYSIPALVRMRKALHEYYALYDTNMAIVRDCLWY